MAREEWPHEPRVGDVFEWQSNGGYYLLVTDRLSGELCIVGLIYTDEPTLEKYRNPPEDVVELCMKHSRWVCNLGDIIEGVAHER